MIMELAEIVGAGKPLKLSTKPIPKAPENGFLLKTTYSGVCHSDLHLIHDENQIGGGKVFRRRDVIGEDAFRGIVPGHEIGGTILEFGSKVNPNKYGLKVGDNVVVDAFCGCQKCPVCKAGYWNVCLENVAGRYDIGLGPLTGPGGYASHVPVAECSFAVKVPDNVPMDMACTIACGAMTAYNALLSSREAIAFANKCYSQVSLLIVGAGGLGLWGLQLARLVYPDVKFMLHCLDVDERKRSLAEGVGAEKVFIVGKDQGKDDQVKLVTQHGSLHYDLIIDFVGHPKTAEVMLEAVKKNGTIIMVGLFGGGVTLPLPLFVWKALTVRGVRTATPQNLRDLIALVSANIGNITYPTPEFIQLAEINEALTKLEAGQIKGRAVLKF